MFTSHYIYLVGGAQVLAGLLLLINRYMALALILSAALLANILTFHLTMQSMGLGMAFVCHGPSGILLAWERRAFPETALQQIARANRPPLPRVAARGSPAVMSHFAA